MDYALADKNNGQWAGGKERQAKIRLSSLIYYKPIKICGPLLSEKLAN